MVEKLKKNKQEALKIAKDAKEVIDLIAIGNSMEPLLQSNSTVYVEFNHIDNIRVGDIIAFYDKYGVSIHRCIKKKETTILERGDGCNLWVKCNWINSDDLIGKVIYVECENQRLILESHKYKLYSLVLTIIGKTSALIGKVKGNDLANNPHVSLREKKDIASKLIIRLIKLFYRILIKYETPE